MSAIQVTAQNNATFARSLVLAMPGYTLPLALSPTVYFIAQLRSTLDPTQAAFQQIWLTFDSRVGSIAVVSDDATANTVTLALLAPARAMAGLDPANTYYADLLYVAGGNGAFFGSLAFAISQGATLDCFGPAPAFGSLASWPPLVDIAGASPAAALAALQPAALATALVALIQSLPTHSPGPAPILWNNGGIPTYS